MAIEPARYFWNYSTGRQIKNGGSFAALKSNGAVVTWGHPDFGGNSSSISAALSSGVVGIYSNGGAFAALKVDGSVYAWGYLVDGGHSRAWGYLVDGGNSQGAAAQLSGGVIDISSTWTAFAALKADGSVMTWGDPASGGDSSAVASSLSSGVAVVFSSQNAFAALKADGSVVTWGDPNGGGNASTAATQLADVVQIFATSSAFAALKRDGSVVTWGKPQDGGDSASVAFSIGRSVVTIGATRTSFAALKQDGSVVTWGNPEEGGDSSAVTAAISSNVARLFSTNNSFAALKADGSVISWGSGYTPGVSNNSVLLSGGVIDIYSNYDQFAALKSDGSVVCWRLDTAPYTAVSSGVVGIWSTNTAFAALRQDGSVVTWGHYWQGGNSDNVASQISSGVISLYSSGNSFAALKSDGSVVSWGEPDWNNFSDVASQLTSGVVTIASPIFQASVAIAATSANKGEGNTASTPFTFTVTRYGDSNQDSTVNWAVTGSGTNQATASDFVGNVLPTGALTFASGETTKTITVNVVADSTVEPDEGFTVTLSNSSAGTTISTATASGLIQNDDALGISIVALSADKAEGNGGLTPFTFQVTRNGSLLTSQTVDWIVEGKGTFTAWASDFENRNWPSGTVTFAAGESLKTITVNVLGDTTVEGYDPAEEFTVRLINPTAGLTLGSGPINGLLRRGIL